MDITKLKDFISRQTARRIQTYTTSETRLYKARYIDPLTLNFKLMIDWDRVDGLLASEINPNTNQPNINSALNYLNRIGEVERHDILELWIHNFKKLVRDYDFLLQSVEGIDAITNQKPGNMFTEGDKLSFNFNETSDMRIQSLITTYRHIWYDDVRMVEVLPENLRLFDLSVLIYAGGYYNMGIYDEYDIFGDVPLIACGNNNEKQIFPTLRKLSDEYFNEKTKEHNFSYHLINVEGCQFNSEDNGKKFFETLTNEQGNEIIKNTMVMNYKFGEFSAIFNNLFGPNNLADGLATISNINNNEKGNYWSRLKSALKTESDDFLSNVKCRSLDYSKLLGPLQNIVEMVAPENVAKALGNMGDKGFTALEDIAFSQITKLGNIVMSNLPTDLMSSLKNLNVVANDKNRVKTMEFEGTKSEAFTSEDGNISTVSSDNSITGVTFEDNNIYDRDGF